MGTSLRIGVIATGSPEYGPATVLAGLVSAIRAEGGVEAVLFAGTRETA